MTPAMSPPGEAAIEGFIERVKATARKYSLWQRGQRVLVAVSGGPDSVTLLDALVRLAPEEGLGLVVGHFNHGLRGAEAEADALYVERLAGDYGLPFVLGHGDVRAEAPHLGRGIEAAARELRHRFLRWAAADRGCDLIALGHTASDRVETVLMHLLRGSGLWGLRGIPPRRLPFVRPLVELWRSDTEAYCAAMGLEWRLDRTNLEAGASLRNKIRHKLLPLLEREYRHGAQEAVLRCAEAVDLELEWTEPMVKYVLGDAAEIAEGRARLRLKSLKSLPPGLLMRVLRSAAQEALGPLRDWSRVHFEALREAVDKGRTGHVVVLPAGHEARVSYGWLEIGAGTVEVPEIPERLLPVPGSVELPEAAIRLTARIVPRSEAPEPGP
ncbi:MAG: tRNA lysidine(34) synthetase TilS, partial [Armatimonadota bacterium]